MSRELSEKDLLCERIVELETKIAFQEESVRELSEVLAHQQMELRDAFEQIRRLNERLKSIADSQVAPESAETPPPHY